MKIKEAFPDVPVIDLSVGVEAPSEPEPQVEEAVEEVEPVPDPLEATITKEEAPKKKKSRKKKADDEPLG